MDQKDGGHLEAVNWDSSMRHSPSVQNLTVIFSVYGRCLVVENTTYYRIFLTTM